MCVWAASQAAALAAERRAAERDSCGCDEVHGTRLGYDDDKGEVIILEPDDDTDLPPTERDGLHPGSTGVQSDIGQKRAAQPNQQPRNAQRQRAGSLLAKKPTVIDLTGSDDENEVKVKSEQKVKPCSVGVKSEASGGWEWACVACTLLNAPWSEACGVCGTPHSRGDASA